MSSPGRGGGGGGDIICLAKAFKVGLLITLFVCLSLHIFISGELPFRLGSHILTPQTYLTLGEDPIHFRVRRSKNIQEYLQIYFQNFTVLIYLPQVPQNLLIVICFWKNVLQYKCFYRYCSTFFQKQVTINKFWGTCVSTDSPQATCRPEMTDSPSGADIF